MLGFGAKLPLCCPEAPCVEPVPDLNPLAPAVFELFEDDPELLFPDPYFDFEPVLKPDLLVDAPGLEPGLPVDVPGWDPGLPVGVPGWDPWLPVGTPGLGPGFPGVVTGGCTTLKI